MRFSNSTNDSVYSTIRRTFNQSCCWFLFHSLCHRPYLTILISLTVMYILSKFRRFDYLFHSCHFHMSPTFCHNISKLFPLAWDASLSAILVEYKLSFLLLYRIVIWPMNITSLFVRRTCLLLSFWCINTYLPWAIFDVETQSYKWEQNKRLGFIYGIWYALHDSHILPPTPRSTNPLWFRPTTFPLVNSTDTLGTFVLCWIGIPSFSLHA